MRCELAIFRRVAGLALLAGLAGCTVQMRRPSADFSTPGDAAFSAARARLAEHQGYSGPAARNWLDCAAFSYANAENGPAQQRGAARHEATVCTRGLLAHLLSRPSAKWKATIVIVAGNRHVRAGPC